MFKYLEKNRRLLVYTPLFVYWVILLSATSIPADSMPSIGVVDKLNHLLAYFILSVLIFLSLLFQQKYPLSIYKVAIYTIIICFLYGVFDEVHQIFIPGRSAEVLDWIADAGGSLIGIVFMIFLVNKSGYRLKTYPD